MSYIANSIEELLVQHKMTAAALARAGGLTEPQLCRIRNGEQIWISSRNMIRIASAFCHGPNAGSLPKIHAQLLLARLQDECAGPGAKFISIVDTVNPDSIAVSDELQTSRPVLPPRIQKDLDVIADHITRDRFVKGFVQNVADYCRGIRFRKAQVKS